MATATRLTGDELLAKVEELKGQPKSVLVKECGYVGIRKYKNDAGETEERESLNFSDFQDALLKAKGLDLTPESSGGGVRGSQPTYRASVMKNGLVVIGRAYTTAGEFAPGTQFAIEVGINCIQLIRVDPETGEVEDPEFPAEG